MPSRSARYSGSDRPACRMNHTGVCGTGSRRQARSSGLSSTDGRVSGTPGSCHDDCSPHPIDSSATPPSASPTPVHWTGRSRSCSTQRASMTVMTG